MTTLVIYDSKHGNTAAIARAIAAALDADLRHIDTVAAADLAAFERVLIGTPTHGGFPTEGIFNLIHTDGVWQGVAVAAFDTRTKTTTFGYAAPKITRNVSKRGATLLAEPAGFFVRGMEGPLLDGELERAVNWARSVGS